MSTHRYDSIDEYQVAGEDRSHATGANKLFISNYSELLRGRHYSSDWFGPFGRDEARAGRALRDGWPEAVDRVLALAARFRDRLPPPVSMARRIVKADQGDSLELQDVYCGRLDTSWRVPRRQSRRAPREVWLANYMGLSAAESGQKLYWRGAAVAVLTDLLAAAGYHVGILSYSGQVGAFKEGPDEGTVQLEIVVKDPKSPLSLEALAGTTVNPAFYRLLYWRWCAAQPHDLQHGLGTPFSYELPPGHLTGTENVCDESTAVDYITATIASLEAEQLVA